MAERILVSVIIKSYIQAFRKGCSDIEDLAMKIRLSREPNEVGTEDCMSTGIAIESG
jgi:hypothetical protein